jgi:hypothetical protein
LTSPRPCHRGGASGKQKDKKSQIPVQQNLASEEGDEKQYDNDPKLQAALFPLYL